MLYSEIIAVCFQIHTKHINTLCVMLDFQKFNLERTSTTMQRVSWTLDTCSVS
jgi:hypothetical protein